MHIYIDIHGGIGDQYRMISSLGMHECSYGLRSCCLFLIHSLLLAYSSVHSLNFVQLNFDSRIYKHIQYTDIHNYEKRHIWLKSGHFFFIRVLCVCVCAHMYWPVFPMQPKQIERSTFVYTLNLCFDYLIIKFNELQWHFVELNSNYIGMKSLISLTFKRYGKEDGK